MTETVDYTESSDTTMHVVRNLRDIRSWIEEAPDPSSFSDNEAFMAFSVELMSRCIYLLRLGASLAPNATIESRGYEKHDAIIVGHMVRLAKLYEGLATHVSQRQTELAVLFHRMIFECAVRTEYLCCVSPNRAKSLRSFVVTSYRPEKAEIDDLIEKKKKRPLKPIEERMLKSISNWLRKDRITREELRNNKNWKIDGLDFRTMVEKVGGYPYPYSFGNSSHFVHGDWFDICMHHLKRTGEYYSPKTDYRDPDPRISSPCTEICLRTLFRYLRWMKLDHDRSVIGLIIKVQQLNRSVDVAHERSFGAV